MDLQEEDSQHQDGGGPPPHSGSGSGPLALPDARQDGEGAQAGSPAGQRREPACGTDRLSSHQWVDGGSGDLDWPPADCIDYYGALGARDGIEARADRGGAYQGDRSDDSACVMRHLRLFLALVSPFFSGCLSQISHAQETTFAAAPD